MYVLSKLCSDHAGLLEVARIKGGQGRERVSDRYIIQVTHSTLIATVSSRLREGGMKIEEGPGVWKRDDGVTLTRVWRLVPVPLKHTLRQI